MSDSKNNTGRENSGNGNSGNRNGGNGNSGNGNSGNGNSGNGNSGDWNSGDWNSGNRNGGNWNSGDWNGGSGNSGDWNGGNGNSGNGNSGDWNSGDYHNGCFNTNTAKQAYYFNVLSSVDEWDSAIKPRWMYSPTPLTWIAESEMSDKEKVENKDFHTTGGYLRKNDMDAEWRKAFTGATSEEIQQVLDLPNFNAAVFKEITGLDLSGYKPKTCSGKIVEIDGVKYELKAIEQ